jgi:hypothetical protein
VIDFGHADERDWLQSHGEAPAVSLNDRRGSLQGRDQNSGDRFDPIRAVIGPIPRGVCRGFVSRGANALDRPP